jgi:PAS domain S-box-containing protein
MRHEPEPSTALEEVEAVLRARPRDAPGESQADALRRLRRLFAGIPTGIMSNDHETGVIEVNPAMVRMFARPAEEITPDNMLAWTHPDDHGTRVLRDEFDEDKRQSYDVEKRYIRGDGETIWCRVVVENVQGGGQGRSSIAMFEDITERKLAELALREHTDRLAQIIEIQRDVAAADLDPRAVMDLICVRAQRLMGCDGATVMMLDGDRLVFGADSGTRERGTSHQELRRSGLALDSLTGWALLNNRSVTANDLQNDPRANRAAARGDGIGAMIVVPLQHGEKAIGVLQIVANRKDAFVEEDVRVIELLSVVLSAAMSHASEFEAKRAQVKALERLRVIFEGTSMGITRVDTKGSVLEANPAFEEMIGYSTAELRKLPPGKITHPDDWGIHLALHDELIAGTRDSYRYEKRYVRRNGELVWCQLTSVLEYDADGDPSVVTTMIEDISERKAAEAKLLRSQQTEAIAQQQLLLAQNQHLRELDRLKDEFIALVSHELRTPLTSIIGYLELVRDPATGELTEEQREFNAIIERNAQRLLRLVSDLLLLAQVQSGELTLELREVDLAALAADAVEAARPATERKHIVLTLTVDPIPALEGDPTRIAQLLDNLLSNALKFTPEHGRVEITVKAEHGNAVLEVADSGMGISAAEQERLFERFFRTTAATDTGIQGTGLGLTITKAIANAHGGTISVKSEEGHGTVFRVELPLGRE